MNVIYLFSSQTGDIPMGADDLKSPLLLAPGKAHPFLTLGDYFQTIEEFLMALKGRLLAPGLLLDDVREIKIRSEKHGAFYQIASADIETGGRILKFCVIAALSEPGRSCLVRDFEIARSLTTAIRPSYLPRVYTRAEMKGFALCLAEWLEDYNEWHLSTAGNQRGELVIWDTKRGNRSASQGERREIFRQASKILTHYYDTKTFQQIHPWHHAAGDFVVKTSNGKVDVKLTTARNYEPFRLFASEEGINPIIPMVYFFLNLVLRIRLDKEEGVGKVLWADHNDLEAALEGFFESLKAMRDEGRYRLGEIEELSVLLRGFDEKEFANLYGPLLSLYREGDPEDAAAMEAHLTGHITELRLALNRFHV